MADDSGRAALPERVCASNYLFLTLYYRDYAKCLPDYLARLAREELRKTKRATLTS